MLFYQRAGQAKDAAHAGAGWTDAASFTGALQDQHCRLFSDKNNAATERDLRGGWYDAGDLNKYTSWTAGYVETLLRAYAENPTIWTDDYNIPESGNGIPDVLDEAKWGLDFLVRMQSTRRLGAQHRGRAVRQPALGRDRPEPVRPGEHVGDAGHRRRVRGRRAHPQAAEQRRAEHRRRRSADAREATPGPGRSRTRTCSSRTTTARADRRGSGSGQQETDDYGRLVYKLDAAAQLFAATGDATYKTFFDANYNQLHLISYSNYVAPWDVSGQDAALDYADATGATAATVTAIRNAYLAGAKGSGNLGAITGNRDPYLAYMQDYVWGSNSTKSQVGNLFAAVVSHKPGRGVERGHDAGGVALRALPPRHEPAVARLPDEHVRARRRELRQRDVPHLVRRRQRDVGSRRHVDLRPAARLPDGRPQPGLRLGRLLPVGLRRHRQQRGLHVDADLAAQGPARAEVVQGLQHRLAARARGASPSRATATRWRTSACCRSSCDSAIERDRAAAPP